eukprot:CAMPEP_0194373696 /NCGR_PEP_ID=MMETSP0174-20130528/22173_1 /TAXON_ID=216777 /ORGANISM="Proboscia alata, Strain PI-D3" /LENGTH=601 /DNA_ID=CAMNT_0039152943 /DNA_START=45 /DNA_END=1850 /DNA_ORIENTATION=+
MVGISDINSKETCIASDSSKMSPVVKKSNLPKSLPSLATLNSSEKCSGTSISSSSIESMKDMKSKTEVGSDTEFLAFRMHYLIVHIAIMLADGLQGTHLYVLYEGYGYSVASLYCLGFVSAALASPFTGPLVDKIGRRRAAILYCLLEMSINTLEQYSNIYGLIASRVVGGITTNLLFTVFESWLVTEHRKRNFPEEKLEIILRDSVIGSNSSAIVSGFIAHHLADYLGPVGPFQGAVGFTTLALLLVFRWEENYGSNGVDDEEKSMTTYMKDAFNTIMSDSKIFRIGLIQGLTEGALQTFIFLWSPTMVHFVRNMDTGSCAAEGWIVNSRIGPLLEFVRYYGMDSNGEPAYGLIFGSFMAAGVLGGLFEPTFRRTVSNLISGKSGSGGDRTHDGSEDEEKHHRGVELLASLCFIAAGILLSTPVIVSASSMSGATSFSLCLIAFLMYEFLVGLYMPCEGMLRTIYMPNDSICSLMTMLRVIVNISVSLGVISSNYVPFSIAFGACSAAMFVAAAIQLTLVSRDEWCDLSHRVFGIKLPSVSHKVEMENTELVSAPLMLGRRTTSISNYDDSSLEGSVCVDNDISSEGITNGYEIDASELR